MKRWSQMSHNAARFGLAAGAAGVVAAITLAVLIHGVGFRSVGIASSLAGLAFLATFEAGRRRLDLGPSSAGPRPKMFLGLIVGAVVYLFASLPGLLTDVLQVSSALSLLLAVLLSTIVLYVAIDRARFDDYFRREPIPVERVPFDRPRVIGLLAVAAIALAIRGNIILHIFTQFVPPVMLRENFAEMDNLPQVLAITGSFGNLYSLPTGPTAHLSPIYPSIVAIIYTFLGAKTFAATLVQSLLATVVSTLAIMSLPWFAVRAGLSERAGWLAAFVAAAIPVLVHYEIDGVWEGYFVAPLLLLLLFCLIELRRDWRDPVVTATCGLLAGIAALFNPALLPAIALTVLACALFRDGRWRDIARATVIVGLMAAVMLAPWAIRNKIVLGEFALRSNFGLELSIGNGPKAKESFEISFRTPGNPDMVRHPTAHLAEARQIQVIGEVAYMRARGAEAVAWIGSNPAQFGILTLKRMRAFWFPDPRFFPGRSTFSVAIRVVVLATVSALALLFLVRLTVMPWPQGLILAAGLIGPTLVYMITHVDMRYRLPIHLLSLVVAAEMALLSYALVRRRWAALSTAHATSIGPDRSGLLDRGPRP